LAIISGYVNLLIAGKPGEVNSRQLRALRDICASSRRLEHRISRLLVFGSQQANRLTFAWLWQPLLRAAAIFSAKAANPDSSVSGESKRSHGLKESAQAD
jgi:hypothetical protein